MIRGEENAINLCQIPALTVLLWTVFYLLELRVAVVTSFESNEQRQGIIDEFNRQDLIVKIPKRAKCERFTVIYTVCRSRYCCRPNQIKY